MGKTLLPLVILVHLGGYTLYVWGMVQDRITPNTTTWSLLLLIVVLDFPTYFQGIETDAFIKSFLPLVDCLGVIVVWTFAFTRGKFERPDRWDFMVASCQALTLAIWKIAGAMDANLMLQVATAIAFVPIIRGVYAWEEVEKPIPWMMWSFSYGLQIVIVYIHPHGWKEFAYPIVCLVLHFAVGVFSLRVRPLKGGRHNERIRSGLVS